MLECCARRSAVFLALVLGGCESGDPIARAAQPLTGQNGVSYNGVSYNGVSYNGVSYNGVSYNGVSYNGVSYNGVSYNGVSFNGASFAGVDLGTLSYAGSVFGSVGVTGTLLTGLVLQGRDLYERGYVDVEMRTNLESGESQSLRISGVRLGAGGQGGILYYQFQALRDGAWAPLCGVDSAGEPLPATIFRGVFDTRVGVEGGGAFDADVDAFSIVCKGSTAMKCVEAGYRPWAFRNGEPLLPLFQACVRTIRADYCGDGQSFTVNGRTIDLWDRYPIQAQVERDWAFEAEWGQDGATCIKETRLELPETPACVAARLDGRCGRKSVWAQDVWLRDSFQERLLLP